MKLPIGTLIKAKASNQHFFREGTVAKIVGYDWDSYICQDIEDCEHEQLLSDNEIELLNSEQSAKASVATDAQ